MSLTDGDPINISISYNSTTQVIFETVTDSITQAAYYTSYGSVNLPTILQGSSAYVGFTGATGGLNALQEISNFSFSTHASPPPPPGSIAGFSGFSLNAANGAGVDGSAPQDNNHGAAPTLSSDDNTLTLTTASTNEASSAFYSSPVPYENFTANFTYTETQGSPPADGFTFTLEDDSRGADALGGGGGDFGYSTDSNHPATAIGDSFAIEFNISDGSSTGEATDGGAITNASQTGAVILTSGDAISVTLTCSSSTLTETLTDTRTNETYSTTYTGLNLPALLGANTAYVGFTGGTGDADALQAISNFNFEPNSAVPPPPPPPGVIAGFNGFVLNAANGAGIDGSSTLDNNNGTAPTLSASSNTLTLTTAANNEASSAFYSVPVTYQNFTASFTYTEAQGSPAADGITFALEDDARGAFLIGGGGGALGYSSGTDQPATGIAPSFAAEFDVYQGSDISLGAAGTIGTTTASNTGSVNLASGDPINISLVYNSSTQTLTEMLTDATSKATFTTVYNNVNVAALVGSNTAYIGFTGGTGGADALQTITNFVYTNNASSAAPTTSASSFAQFALNASSGNSAGVPSLSSDEKTLTLTTVASNEAASAFDPTPVYYDNFRASFVYTDFAGGGSSGFTFTLEDDTRGADALGAAGVDLGYAAGASGGPAGISPSLSLQFNASPSSTSGQGTNGSLASDASTGSVNLASGDPIQVNLVYSTTALTLTETLTDTKTSATYSNTFGNVNIAQLLGQQSALVGFTGGTTTGALQTISNFSYTALIAPQVSLSSYYNRFGIATDGVASVGGGFDDVGNSLSYTFFGAAQTVNSPAPPQTFFFGPTGIPNTISAIGQIIALPQQSDQSIVLLGASVDAPQPGQTVMVNYTNGTSTSFNQSFSDWSSPQNYPDETTAFSMSYRLTPSGGQQGGTFYLYEYTLPTNPTLTVQSITLPDSPSVKVLAINVNAELPSVTGVMPSSGPATGGTSVIITGSGFTGASAVDFGTTPATSFTVNSTGTQITAIDPAGIAGTTVDVTVVTSNGTSATSPADQFTILPSWLAAGSAATWNAFTNTLSLTGSATIIADPGSAEPKIFGNGPSAKLTITPATSPTDVHIGGVSLFDGASIVMSNVDASQVADGTNASNHHTDHNVLVIGTLGASSDPTISLDPASKLDLGDNDLIVHTGFSDTGTDDGQGNAETNELKAIEALAAEGRNVAAGGIYNGTWTGNGLTSSAAATADSDAGYEQNILAVEQNSDMYLGGYSTWTVGSASETLGANDIIVKYTYNGDLNLDGAVDGNAATIFSTFYDGGATSGNTYAHGDLNGDGKIDGNDATIFSTVYGNGLASSGLPQL